MAILLSPADWTERTGNSAYAFQVISGAAKPQFPWAGDVSKAPVASYVRTMLFNDYTVTGTVETPASDDIPILFLRANNSGSVLLAAYNNNNWSIYSSVSPYASFTATLDLKAASAAVQSYGDGAVISFSAQGNTYIASLNGTEVVRWVDQRGDWAANVNSAHHEFAMSYLCSTVQGGWDSINADDLYIWPSLTGTTSDGVLSATAVRQHPMSAALSGGGTLSATAPQVPFPTITNITTSPFHVGDTITLTGTGFVAGASAVSVTIGGVAATSVSVSSSTSLTCVVPSVALGARNVVVTAASGASSAYSITLVALFTPFNETNTARTNQTVPAGSTGAYVTLIGAGGGGGSGRNGAIFSTKTGGSGGGGGGYIPRVFVAVASMGATYSVAVQTGTSAGGAIQSTANTNGLPGTAGAATTFVSGSTSMSAGGGGAGGAGGNSTTIPGGTGGAVSGATGDAGTAGGIGDVNVVQNGVDNGTSASGGAGGGGGNGQNSGGSTAANAGKGGNTNGQTGGAGATSGADAVAGSALTAGVAASGGGGGTFNASTASRRKGGNAPGYGGGGGGGCAQQDTPTGAGGTGGPGYSLVEWV